MKKHLLLLLMVALAALSSQAATNYGINVGGVEVSSSNYNNVTGGNIGSGTVKYDPTNKILTLTSVSISRTGGDNYGVHNRSVDGLTMKFVGTCNITCDKGNAIHLDKNTTVSVTGTLNAKMSAGENFGRGVVYVNDNVEANFQGGGTLNVTGSMKSGGSQSSCGIAGFEGKGKSSNSYLNFSNINVSISASQNGIYKFRMVTVKDYSDIKFYNTYSYRALAEVTRFTFTGEEKCVTPADATFNSSGGYFGTNAVYTHFTDNYGVIISTANFPDANFRTQMLGKCRYNGSYREEYLTKSELQSLTSLDVAGKSISNLTGVGLLTYLTTLYCNSNSLSSLPSLPSSLKTLNISNNLFSSLPSLPSSLTDLYCGKNRFTSLSITYRSTLKTLDVSDNTSLTSLSCNNNALTSLNVSGCSVLTTLDCKSNQLTSLGTLPSSLQTLNCSSNRFTSLSITGRSALKTLDVSSNTSLTTLNCYSNALTSLNVNGCSALTTLDCKSNQLTSLGTLPSSLQNLYCGGNKLSGTLTITGRSALKTLDVSSNTGLTTLNCYSNALISLNVSGCSALANLSCYGNLLTSLNVSNNTKLTSLYCYNNALTSLNASGCSVLTTLDCKSNQLTSLGTLPSTLQTIDCSSNKFSGTLSITGRSALKTLDVSSNTSLATLNCYSNALTSLNVNGCSSLTTLDCKSNQLTSLGALPSTLQTIDCSSNKFSGTLSITGRSALKTLNVSSNTSLTTLNCYSNALTSLNVSGCTALTSLDCKSNQLTSLGTVPNSVQTINCSSNKLSGTLNLHMRGTIKTLDVSYNTDLTTLYCAGNALTSLNVNGCTAMTTLDCNSNQLTSLGTLPNSLQTLNCSSNRFTSLSITGRSALKTLDVTNNTSLTSLSCNNNALTSLSVSGCSAMTSLYCYGNQLPSLNVSNNTKLASLNCNSNALTSLNVSGCSALNYLDCSNNTLSSLSVQGTNLSILHIEINNISGDNMTALINSMRTIPADNNPGAFYVFYEDYASEGNAITNEQILLAISKNWKLWKHQNQWVELTVSAVRGDLNGDGAVDVTDVSILIDVVLGKPNDALKPGAVTDLDGNGLIDVSDVGMLIDIVLGK